MSGPDVESFGPLDPTFRPNDTRAYPFRVTVETPTEVPADLDTTHALCWDLPPVGVMSGVIVELPYGVVIERATLYECNMREAAEWPAQAVPDDAGDPYAVHLDLSAGEPADGLGPEPGQAYNRSSTATFMLEVRVNGNGASRAGVVAPYVVVVAE